MKNLLRSLFAPLTALAATAAWAQPLPPYPVTITGFVPGCSPMTSVNIITVQNTQPAVNIDVPVDANCGFTVTLEMDSPQGWFVVSTPCLGAIQSVTASYVVNSSNGTQVSVTIDCGNTAVDCLGVAGGSALPGTACTNFLGVTGIWSADCTCDADTIVYDCLQIPNGPNMPGTPCATPNGAVGTWSAQCVCETGSTTYDCLQIPNGPNMPGTPCTVFGTNLMGTWTADCVCDPDPTGGATDCLGIVNGPNLPGTPCWLLGSNYIGTWDANCDCQNSTGTGCQAGFWAMQAYEMDPNNPNGGGAPIPYEIWVWNLSSGTGNITYSWDFGDGSTSVDPYPTHTYGGNGPYLLCLTISDGTGCTDQVCDSISIDEDGILSGMILDEEEVDGNGTRQDGFTINVQNPLTTGVADAPAMEHTAIWPNPVNDQLNLSFNTTARGSLLVTIMDMDGRVVRTTTTGMSSGTNQYTLEVSDLAAGIYVVRFSSGNDAVNLRFVKR